MVSNQQRITLAMTTSRLSVFAVALTLSVSAWALSTSDFLFVGGAGVGVHSTLLGAKFLSTLPPSLSTSKNRIYISKLCFRHLK